MLEQKLPKSSMTLRRRTLLDTVADIRQHPSLSKLQRRKRAAYFGIFSRGTGRSLDQIDEAISAVSDAIELADPEEAQIGLSTWRTTCSTVRTSLRLCGADYTSARNPESMSRAWGALLWPLKSKLRSRLLPIAGVMSSIGVEPAMLSQEHMPVLWKMVGALYPYADPHEKARVAVEVWNRCKSRPEWPKTPLLPITLLDRDKFPSERFSDAFNLGMDEIRRDALRPKRGVLDRKRPVVPAAAKARCDSMYRVWSGHCLHGGIDPNTLASPYVGLTPDVLDDAIEYYRSRLGKLRSHEMYRDAINARMIARRFSNASTADVERFDRAVENVDPKSSQSETSTGLLLRLRDPDFERRLLTGPQRIMRELNTAAEISLKDALRAQFACAWALLLAAPLKPSELAAIRWPKETCQPVGRLKLVILGADGRPDVYEVPHQLRTVVERYATKFLPLLHPVGDELFPGKDGHKQAAHLAKQLCKLVSHEMQVHIPTSAIRLLTGGIYLLHRAGQFDVVRRLFRQYDVAPVEKSYATLRRGEAHATIEKAVTLQQRYEV